MPSRKLKKRSQKRIIRRLKPERGKISEKLVFVVIALLLLVGAGMFIWKPWQSMNLPFTASKVAAVKPNMDMSRARQMTIDPSKDSVMQIVTKEKVRVTLEIPKGALKEKTLVKLIPFYYDKKSAAPTAGVVVGPAAINFEVPITLSFNFTESEFKNQAPKTVLEQKIRATGLSQVMQVDKDASSLTPTLVIRELETEEYLPSRILTGGAYVFSLDGKHQTQIARIALDKDRMHTLTIMESATALLFNNQKLTDIETKKTKAAVAKILSKKSPPPFELYAALILKKKLTNPKFTFVPTALAYTTDEGFYQVVCRQDNYTVEQYVGFAKGAQLLGQDEIGDSCLNKAKNKAAEEAKKVLESGNPGMKAVMLALQNLQILGVDQETNLDEQLEEKAKEVVTKDAQKVANDPNSSVVDAAVEMQKMEAAGADSGPTYEALKNKVNERLKQIEDASGKASDEYSKQQEQNEADWDKAAKEVEEEEKKMEDAVNANDIDEESILYNQAMSVLGIELLKAFGFENLDKESLKEKFDAMQEQSKELVADFYPWCLEMRAEGADPGDCEGYKSQMDSLLNEAENLSYRVENEVGNAQSQEYEEPDYLQNNGDYELYFEEDLTPTPEDGEDVGVNENGDDVPEDDSRWSDNNGPESSSIDDGSDESDHDNNGIQTSTDEGE